MKRFTVYLLLLCLLLAGCDSEVIAQRQIFAMDTYMSLKIWGDDEVLTEVVRTIQQLDSLLDVTNENSELYQLNHNRAAAVSDMTADLIRTAISEAERTGGAFDPTIYPLTQAWGFTTDTQQVPSQEAIDALLPCVGTAHILVDGTQIALTEGAQLDLGGIAKGYAAQVSIELLQARGIKTALLSLGGNVQTLGSKPDGEPWVIGIANPEKPSEEIAILTFTGSLALVTSGGYQRYFEQAGVRYSHILDPETGYPADNGLASVTILTQDGTTADALSTALYVMGLERASEFWRESSDFEAVFITESGEILATAGAAPLLSGCEFQVIER